jgi:hypothetical protein
MVLATVFARPPNSYPSTYCIRFDTDVKNAAQPIIINVTQRWAPVGANHLFDVISSKFYAVPAAFFRVVPNFVVQFGISGDPKQNGIWNKTIVDGNNSDVTLFFFSSLFFRSCTRLEYCWYSILCYRWT